MAEYQLDAEGYIIKTDRYDVGVRMKPPADGVVYGHPENVYAALPLRGDYSQKTQPRIHWRRGRLNIFNEYVVDGRGEGSHG